MNGLEENARLRRPSIDTISTTVGAGDVNNKINWIYFLLGCAMLLPWNAMITATPFFLERMANSSLRPTFSSYFSVVYQISSFIALAHASYTAASASKPTRITLSHMFITITLLLLFLSTFVPSSATLFFIFALTVGACQAVSGTYLLTSVVSYAAYFGPASMQSIMSGQAAVAVVVSIIQLATTVATLNRKGSSNAAGVSEGNKLSNKFLVTAVEGRSQLSVSASYFFSIATLGLIVSYIGYRRMTKMKTFRSTIARFEAPNAGEIDAEYAVLPTTEERERLAEETNEDDDDMLAMSTSISSLRDSEIPAGTSIRREGTVDSVGSVKTMEEVEPNRSDVNFIRVWKANAIYNLSVMWIYVVTLAFFPAITTSVSSVNPDIFTSPQVFTAIHFLIFNSADWFGRYICSYPRFQIWSRKRLLGLSLLRSFVGLIFLACNVNLGSSPKKSVSGVIAQRLLRLPFRRGLETLPEVASISSTPLINSDILFFLILTAFGVSNGWLTSLIMMAAPSLVHNKRMRKEWVDVAAVGTSFSLAAGLVLGSIANFAVRGMICDCNPFAN